MPVPADFASFDIANAALTIWVFKKSGGTAGAVPVFTGHWVDTDVALQGAVKEAILTQRAAIEEVHPYGLLAQNNEASALSISADETFAEHLVAKLIDPIPIRRATSPQHLQNTNFYVVKLVSDGQSMFCVKKTDASWGSKKRRAMLDVLFREQILVLETASAFALSAYVDFFILNGVIYMLDKGRFESVLSYRQAHLDQFQNLQNEVAFSAIFSDLAPLVAFIGTNKIQLRRACAIETKAHYRDPVFMDRLRARFDQYLLNIIFDEDGRIVPTPETCADIMTALLDHRLSSAFSETVYDVPDTVAVA